jgi:uncharacterized membrane protein YqhA
LDKFFHRAAYLSLVGVFSLLLASVAAFGWGAIKTFNALVLIVKSSGKDPFIPVSLIGIVDSFLIATALFVFSVSMYELFVGKLGLPNWMLAHNLHELKEKLGGVIILVMAVVFLEHVIEWQDAYDALLYALGIAVVSAAIIALGHFGDKE